jgi:peptidoglycan/xylan/chitin deacetylase (PgdA/CDA1 family)
VKLTLLQRISNQVANRQTLGVQPVRLDRGMLSVTFDDFPRTAWTVAGPILAGFGARATYYVSGCFLDAQNRGLAHYRADDLAAVTAAGHELGCHTFDHVSTFEVDVDRWVASVEANARFVDSLLPGTTMRTFAYPYGHVRTAHRKALAVRFATQRGIRPIVRPGGIDRTLLPATGLEMAQPGIDWDAAIATAAAERSWLILYTHEVQDDPTPYGTTPAHLERVLGLARQAGLDVVPVSEGYGRITGR